MKLVTGLVGSHHRCNSMCLSQRFTRKVPRTESYETSSALQGKILVPFELKRYFALLMSLELRSLTIAFQVPDERSQSDSLQCPTKLALLSRFVQKDISLLTCTISLPRHVELHYTLQSSFVHHVSSIIRHETAYSVEHHATEPAIVSLVEVTQKSASHQLLLSIVSRPYRGRAASHSLVHNQTVLIDPTERASRVIKHVPALLIASQKIQKDSANVGPDNQQHRASTVPVHIGCALPRDIENELFRTNHCLTRRQSTVGNSICAHVGLMSTWCVLVDWQRCLSCNPRFPSCHAKFEGGALKPPNVSKS